MLQAAAVVATFNLICTGTLTTRDMSGDRSEPYRTEYRIDLDQRKWCEAECRALHDIADIGPAQITLTETERETARESSMSLNSIDRETGEHRLIATSDSRLTGILIMEWRGTCERAPFSGFPTFNVRF